MLQGPRAAHEEEIDALVGLATSAFNPNGVPAGNADMGAAFPTLLCPDNLPNLRIVTDGGRPVSMAGFTVREISIQGARIRVACVGAVCTLASHRGRGIAAAIMEDVEAGAGARGAMMLLISGDLGLYRRMGCIDADTWQVVRVNRRSRLPTLACEVREWAAEDVLAMALLHQGEPIRFLRDAREMRALLQARSLFARPARAAVLAAVPAILRATREERMDIETAWTDSEMRCLASLYCLASETRGMHGTTKIIDTRGLLAALMFGSVERAGRSARPPSRPSGTSPFPSRRPAS